MVAMQAVIAFVAASHWDHPAYTASIRRSIGVVASDDPSGKGENDLVITPGGPRPRRQVHQVRPGETVRQNEDGTFTIVPGDVPASPEPGSKKPDEK